MTTHRPETDDAAALRSDIEHTREALGETVAALTAKADVKARASEKVQETKTRVADKVADAKAKVGHTAEAAKEKVGHTAETAKEKVGHTADAAKEHTTEAPAAVVEKARAKPAVPAAGLLAALLAGALVLWLIRSRG